MKSVLAVAFLLATTQALSEAKHTRSLYKCDIKGIENDVKEMGTESLAVVLAIAQNTAEAIQGIPACLKLSPSKILPCVESSFKTQCATSKAELQQWASRMATLGSDLGQKVQSCL